MFKMELLVENRVSLSIRVIFRLLFIFFLITFILFALPFRGLAELSTSQPGKVRNQPSSQPVPGQNWTSPATSMRFIWIEAIEKWVGKYEVTNYEYRLYKPDHSSGAFEGHSLNGDRQPVVDVNFYDAQAFGRWLTTQDQGLGLAGGYRYRLPTGEEWTVFAQCGDSREYPWGDAWPPLSGQAGNYRDEAFQRAFEWYFFIAGYDDDHAVTAPVDEIWPNPWGLYGVGGNVWEATKKTAEGEFEAWRGGSWMSIYRPALSCTFHYDVVASSRYYGLGFRLLLEPTP